MIYYELDDKVINKYEITYDINRLNEIKKEIINNCSKIEHVEIEREYSFNDNYFENKLVKNHTSESIGFKEYYDGTRSVYLHRFDLLTPPNLVELIDRLLSDDKSVINEIYSYQDEKVSFDKEIDEKNKEIDNINNSEVDKKIEKLKELKKLLALKYINRKQKSTKEYYIKLLDYIYVTFISSVNINDSNIINDFFNMEFNIENGNITFTNDDNKEKIINKKP